MKISHIRLAYFSATYTTREIARLAARTIGCDVTEYDVTCTEPTSVTVMSEDELLIMAAPVYAGRIPAAAAERFNAFQGSGTPALVLCVYGNRAYDDALLEMKDIVRKNGFALVAAGAFIARHSIFPSVAATRPDGQDMERVRLFAEHSAGIISKCNDAASLPEVAVKGDEPYKVPGSIPFSPKGDSRCIECGKCADLCPTQAIPVENPRSTVKERCIACGRCIVVCPTGSRHFHGLIYEMAGKKFIKAYSERKEPEVSYAE